MLGEPGLSIKKDVFSFFEGNFLYSSQEQVFCLVICMLEPTRSAVVALALTAPAFILLSLSGWPPTMSGHLLTLQEGLIYLNYC